MKKTVFLLAIVLVCLFIGSCGAFNEVSYCPYCKSTSIAEVADKDNVYKCDNCGKTFGAMEVKKGLLTLY